MNTYFTYSGYLNGYSFLPRGAMTNEGIANAPFANYLPLLYTNYGGDFQVSVMRPPINFMTGMYTNPMGTQILGTSYYNPGSSSAVNPVDNSAQINKDVDASMSQIASQNINTLLTQTIPALKTKINSALSDATGATQQKLQAALEKVNGYEEQLKNLKQEGADRTSTKTPKEVYDEVDKIKNELNNINKEVAATAENSPADNEAPTDNEDTSDDNNNNQTAQTTNPADSTATNPPDTTRVNRPTT